MGDIWVSVKRLRTYSPPLYHLDLQYPYFLNLSLIDSYTSLPWVNEILLVAHGLGR